MQCRLPRRIGFSTSVDYADNFADNDWATIAAVCAYGLVPATWKIGDQKAMTINGASYLVDIIGIQHDDYADGSGKAPFTFQMHNVYGTDYRMNSSSSNSCGWVNSLARKTHLPAILALMPQEVQNAIQEVKKLTSIGGGSNTISDTADKLFLLSCVETTGSLMLGTSTIQIAASGEGSQYEYYAVGGSTAKQRDGSQGKYWTRSPQYSDSTFICSVNGLGDAETSNPTATGYGLAFAFCF